MGRTRTAGALAAVTMIALTLSSCGGDSTEDLISKAIEEQTGDDVDVDLDDGGINVQTEDGNFSIDEDGNFTVEGEDGQEITGDVDTESGDVDIESEDGDLNISSSGEIPDEWPSGVPEPPGSVDSSSVVGTEDGQMISLIGTFEGEPADFVASYGAELEGAGFEKLGDYSSGDTAGGQYGNDSWSMSIGASTASGSSQFSVTVAPNNS